MPFSVFFHMKNVFKKSHSPKKKKETLHQLPISWWRRLKMVQDFGGSSHWEIRLHLKKNFYLKILFVYSLILFLVIILLKFSYYTFYFKIYLLLFIFMYFKFWILVSWWEIETAAQPWTAREVPASFLGWHEDGMLMNKSFLHLSNRSLEILILLFSRTRSRTSITQSSISKQRNNSLMTWVEKEFIEHISGNSQNFWEELRTRFERECATWGNTQNYSVGVAGIRFTEHVWKSS